MESFVRAGDTVNVYQKPFSSEEFESQGVVLEVIQNNGDSAYVRVDDGDKDWGPIDRWILPAHVVK